MVARVRTFPWMNFAVVESSPNGSLTLTESRSRFILSVAKMQSAQAPKNPVCGAASATEELLPEPTQVRMALQRLTDRNAQLRLQLKHLQAALKIAANVLQPYFHASMVGNHKSSGSGSTRSKRSSR